MVSRFEASYVVEITLDDGLDHEKNYFYVFRG